MKNVVILLLFMLLYADASFAQTKKHKAVKKEQSRKVSKAPTIMQGSDKIAKDNTTTTLTSTSTNGAKAPQSPSASLKINDATVNTLNMRARGMDIPVSGSGIVGMPKVTYGIANGKLLLRTTDAPAIGSTTGPGSVGTGTSLGTMGTSGNGLGVNRKNPYAGPNIYGTRPYGSLLSPPTNITTAVGINRKD